MNTSAIGVLYAVLAALGFALWNILMQRAMERGAPARASLFTLSATVTVIGIPMVGLEAAQGGLSIAHPIALAFFGGSGLITAALAPFLSTQATRRVGAAQTTALRLLDPMFAFMIALVVLGEPIVWQAAGGVLLIMAALGLLQLEGRQQRQGEAVPGNVTGLLFGVGASLLFTIGSSMRKLGLEILPSAPLSVLAEGVMGLVVVLTTALWATGRAELKAAFDRRHLDLWWSALGGAFGTVFVNMALAHLPFPIAVALRNTSPWFALLLVPLLLGSQYRPGRLTWISTLLLTAGMLLILLR